MIRMGQVYPIDLDVRGMTAEPLGSTNEEASRLSNDMC